jgi:hypothetical protein
MRTWRLLLIITAIVVFITSCKKEKSNEDGITQPPPTVGGPLPSDTTPGANTEVGDWTFISLTGKTESTAEFSQSGMAGKAVNKGSFTSQDNGGTVTFDNSTMTANGITMAINATTTTDIFLNGIPVNSMQTPLNETFPPQDATSAYTKVGADSLHFADGGFLNALTGGLLPNAPTGCKLKFEGDLMKMTVIVDTVVSQDFQGFPAKVRVHAELLATLQKNP